MKKIVVRNKNREAARQKAMPSVQDQLDAIWEILAGMAKGEPCSLEENDVYLRASKVAGKFLEKDGGGNEKKEQGDVSR